MLKYKIVLSLIAFVLITGLSFVGCDDDGDGSTQDARALTEKDFAMNPKLFANPDKGVVVSFLEPEDVPVADNLTGEVGFDVIPYKYARAINNTFCFEDSNDDSLHFMILLNSDGEEVLRAQANGDCVTEVIEAGDYQVVLTHGEHVDEIEPVFLRPIPGEEQVAKGYGYVPAGFVRFFENINNLITRSAIAQTDTSDNVTTLISTNACVDCNLMGVDLTGNDLSFANLSGANLSEASLSGVELFNSTLTGADLSGADLSDTNGATDLRGTEMTGADLSGADLTGADLTSAILTSADLTGADITGAEFENANLVGATWIDGSTCNISSIGACYTSGGDSNPCESLALGITHDFNVAYICLLPTVEKEVCADPCPADPSLAEEGCGKCTTTDPDELVISVDLVDIFDQASSSFGVNLDHNTPIAIMAWGGEGGLGADNLVTSGGDGGASGFASTVTTLSDFQNDYGQTSFYFYLAQAGTLSDIDGDGASSTLAMLVESNPGSLNDILLIAGGGGGGESAGILSGGYDGGKGGIAASSQIGQGFIGIGQNVGGGGPDGGSINGEGLGGNGTNDGKDGIGGEGGQGFLGLNSEWINGDPGVGSNGRGGNADDSFSSSGGGGGGGGYGGGGAGDGTAGAGGGSWSEVPTITCDSAPNNDAVPSNPGTIRDSYYNNSNGAVEIWIFPDGC